MVEETATSSEPTLTLSGIFVSLLRRLPVIAYTALAVMLIAVAFSLLRPARYSAESSFVPQVSGQGSSGIAGLAAQFGIAVPSGAGMESLAFYTSLLESRTLLVSVAQSSYTTDEGERPLAEILGIEAETEAATLAETVSELRDIISVQANAEASVVRLRTETESAALAVQINARILDLLNEFHFATRQSNARAEREFVEARLREAQDSLYEAERMLEAFLQRNRTYATSPQLAFEHSRLASEVERRRTMYAGLSGSYESARISEIRNTPVVTVIDRPEGSARRTGNLLRMLVLAALIGSVLGVGIAFVLDRLEEWKRTDPAAHARVRAAFRQGLRSLVPGRRG